ncbi:hypothetical protein HK102_001703, partial [Quaeritorhiza haematococci]
RILPQQPHTLPNSLHLHLLRHRPIFLLRNSTPQHRLHHLHQQYLVASLQWNHAFHIDGRTQLSAWAEKEEEQFGQDVGGCGVEKRGGGFAE